MKKYFYLLTFFLTTGLLSQAQIMKGSILAGGNIGFSTNKTTPVNPVQNYQAKETSINISPSIGIAIKDNLLEGFDLAYSYANQEQAYSVGSGQFGHQKVKNSLYGVGFFLRQYKYLGNRFYLFMQGRLGASYVTGESGDDRQSSTITHNKIYGVTLGFYPGISYAITKKVQLETGFQNLFSAQYSHEKDTYENTAIPGNNSIYKTNSFSLGTSLSNSLNGFVIGFKVLLGS